MKNKRILILLFVLVFLFLVGCQTTPVVVKRTEIKVSPDKITMSVGETLQLEVTALYNDGSFGDITPDCIYESSNTFIVIVNTYEGLVIAKAPGKATIVVVDSYEGKHFADTAEITVRADVIEEVVN